MTRINCVPPSELTDAHLGAEYRELPRVFRQALEASRRGELPWDPRNPRVYTLGRGHVRFFYPRLAWVAARHQELVQECRRRGRHVSFDKLPAHAYAIPAAWWGDWRPTRAALALNRQRISDNLAKSRVL